MKRFPIIMAHGRAGAVPWGFVERFRVQIERNHDQSLERLAQRGGLSFYELWCGLEGKRLVDVPKREVRETVFRPLVEAAIEEWQAKVAQEISRANE